MATQIVLPPKLFGLRTYASTAVTTTAAALSAATSGEGIWIANDPASGINIAIGDSASQPIILAPGGGIFIPTRNPSSVFVKSASGTPTVYSITFI